MRWRSAWLTACSCALLLAGCGGEERRPPPAPPRIPAAVAEKLAADADRVAATPGCAARDAAVTLQSDVIASISRIPPRYQEQLTSAATDLVTRIPPCPQPAPEDEKHGRDHHGKHGRKKGHD
jgi:hypothetical protein